MISTPSKKSTLVTKSSTTDALITIAAIGMAPVTASSVTVVPAKIFSTQGRSYIFIREAGLFDVSQPSYRILRQSRNSIGRLAYSKIQNGRDRDEHKWSRQPFHRFHSESNREVEIPLHTRASSTTNDWFDPFQGRKSSSASRPPASEGIVPVDCML